MAGTATTIITIFITSLFISSFLISYFAIQIYGNDLGVKIVDYPKNLESYSGYATQQNFKTSQFNESILDVDSHWENQINVGEVLISAPIIGNGVLNIKYIKQESSGITTNTYYINNSGLGSFNVILFRDSLGNKYGENVLKFDENGIHALRSEFSLIDPSKWNPDVDFISYPNINRIKSVVLTTKFNQKDNTVEVLFNGQSFNLKNLNEFAWDSSGLDSIWGGIETNSIGFTLENFNTGIIAVSEFKQNVTDALSQIASIILTMIKVVSWSLPENVMPRLLQMILIVPQEIGLIIGIAGFIRSG